MRFIELLKRSEMHLQEFSLGIRKRKSLFVFTNGAEWMLLKMNELDKGERVFNTLIAYEQYGYLKYGLSLFFFILSVYFFLLKALFLLPLSVVIFYLFEIHFLFLFPLLLDSIERPWVKSIQMTYKYGLLKTLLTVIPIGIFMIIGLLDWRNPLRNWYLGCLSILIWYLDERKRF